MGSKSLRAFGKRFFLAKEESLSGRQRTQPKKLRLLVFQRDMGICALCRCDTILAREILEHALAHLRDMDKSKAYGQWRTVLGYLGFDSKSANWWEADHSQPLCEGGANILGNLRTLCLPCHRKETARLRRRLAKTERLRRKRPRKKYQRYQLSQISQG